MNLVFEENSPHGCQAVGLDCESCVNRSAREIAACCASLGATGIRQIFSSLYPSSGCAPMKSVFADVYLASIQPLAIVAA